MKAGTRKLTAAEMGPEPVQASCVLAEHRVRIHGEAGDLEKFRLHLRGLEDRGEPYQSETDAAERAQVEITARAAAQIQHQKSLIEALEAQLRLREEHASVVDRLLAIIEETAVR